MGAMNEGKTEQHSPVWSVTLTPHRSLSREGFVTIMVALLVINLVGGLFFLAIGAWPVFGFMGLDVLLMWWAFRKNFADGKCAEQISITGDEVLLRTFSAKGVVAESLYNRRWLRVVIFNVSFLDL